MNNLRPVDFTKATEVSQNWHELEQILTGIQIHATADCPLSTERVRGRVRLCYKGVPISEVDSPTKMWAVKFIRLFIQKWLKERDSLEHNASLAAAELQKVIPALRGQLHH